MIERMKSLIKGKKIRVVFPEGDDKRIQEAAIRGAKEGLFIPLLLGKKSEIDAVAKENHFDLSPCHIIDPLTDPRYEKAVQLMTELRQGKNTEEQCREFLKGRNYFATMLVYMKEADCSLGGATYSTADTVRPALQIVKTKPGVKTVSSSFIMLPLDPNKQPLVMGDCAIIPTPTSENLADITVSTAETARVFGIEPVVALLSFSTKGSAKAPEVDKVQQAVALLQQRNVNFAFDGELQFDAAFVPSVGKQKAPGSKVAGYANTFIFPSLEAGNIGYKIAQRLGGYEAIGPILQGLNAPINDLSRGCNAEEVYKMAIITSAQSVFK